MSNAVVKQVIDRAIEDEQFRELLFTDPQKALADFDLTDKQRELLEGINKENFDEFVGNLGGRTTKGFMPGTG